MAFCLIICFCRINQHDNLNPSHSRFLPTYEFLLVLTTCGDAAFGEAGDFANSFKCHAELSEFAHRLVTLDIAVAGGPRCPLKPTLDLRDVHVLHAAQHRSVNFFSQPSYFQLDDV